MRSLCKLQLCSVALSAYAALFICVFSAVAQNEGPPAPETSHGPHYLFQDIERQWGQVLQALATKDGSQLYASISKLSELRNQAGISGLEDYSGTLVQEAHQAFLEDRIVDADYLTRKAIELSPLSPQTLFSTTNLVSTLRIDSTFNHIWRAVAAISHSPFFAVSLLSKSLYPLLWSLTIAVYIVYLFTFIISCGEILRGLSGWLSPKFRGWLTPTLFLALVSFPIFFGPLICLSGWALVLWISGYRAGWACRFSGVLIILWALLVPIRESLYSWQQEDGPQTILNVSSGNFHSLDRFRLEQYTAAHPFDGIAWYTYGQVLRKHGNYEGALQAQNRAEKDKTIESYVLSEKGTLLLLQGKPEAAQELYERAAQDITSAALSYNRAKASLENLDTARARIFLAEAQKLDREFVEMMDAKEGLSEAGSSVAVADVNLSFKKIIFAVFEQPSSRSSDTLSMLVSKLPPQAVGILGIGLLVVSLIRPFKVRSRKTTTYYREYEVSGILSFLIRVVPGGSWILSGHPLIGTLSLWCVIALVTPLIGWPIDAHSFMLFIPEQSPTYMATVGVITIIISIIGLSLAED